jgi:ankyrin repeat protein
MDVDQSIIDEFVGNAHGNLARVQELAAQYPSIVNAQASWGETALQAAAQVGSRPILEFLLSQGVAEDIFAAIVLGHTGQVRRWLDADPGLIHARGAHGFPILYFAAVIGDLALADELLARGAEVNSASGHESPLHAAARFRQPALAWWLLDHGADPAAANGQGETPAQLAEKAGDAALAALLSAP